MRANCATLLSAVILGASFSCSNNTATPAGDASDTGTGSSSGTASSGSSSGTASSGSSSGTTSSGSSSGTTSSGSSSGTSSDGGGSSGGGDAAGPADGATAGDGSPGGGEDAGGEDGPSGAVVSIFDGKTLNGWSAIDGSGKPAPNAFSVSVADGAIASTGGIRASLYYKTPYSFYRFIYTERQVHRVNHDPGVLFFGSTTTKDALDAVMFALPDNWGWDYRGGGSKGTGTPEGAVPGVNLTDWTTCEVLVDAATGSAKAACAQPVGTKAVEVLGFNETTFPPKIPNVPNYFGILCHTAGEVDEYKDITLEVNPAVNALITTQ